MPLKWNYRMWIKQSINLKVKALKINNRWKFDSSVSNISIDPNTGKIVLQPQFLLTNSKIIVFAKKETVMQVYQFL